MSNGLMMRAWNATLGLAEAIKSTAGAVHSLEASTGTVVKLLDGVSSTGAGTSSQPTEKNRAFYVTISNTATCKLQASMDGTNWFDLRTSTSSEAYSTSEPWPYVRGNVTAYTSGTVTLEMAT